MRQHYPDFYELNEWGMAGAACTHVSVVPARKLLCLWFTQTLEGWPGWKRPEENLWTAARQVALARAARTSPEGAATGKRPAARASSPTTTEKRRRLA